MNKIYNVLIVSAIVVLSVILALSVFTAKETSAKGINSCGTIESEKGSAGCCCNYPVCSRVSLLCCGRTQVSALGQSTGTIAAQ